MAQARACCSMASTASWPCTCPWSARTVVTCALAAAALAWAMEIDGADVVAGLESVADRRRTP